MLKKEINKTILTIFKMATIGVYRLWKLADYEMAMKIQRKFFNKFFKD